MRLLLLLVLVAPLAAAQPLDGLVGTWLRAGPAASRPVSTADYYPEVAQAPYRLTFDGTGGLAVESGVDLAYTFGGDALELRVGVDGGFETIAASLDGDTLTLTDPDRGLVYAFARDGGAAADGLVGRWLRPEVSGEPVGVPEGFEFAAGGTGRAFYEALVRYVAERGALVTGNPLPLVANVRVTGDRLRLVQKNWVTMYVRADGGGGAGGAAPVVSLQRTACSGRCPEYTLEAYADGRVVWTGRRNVTRVGTAERRVRPAVVAALVAAGEAAGHAGLPEMLAGENVCPEFIPDAPEVITTVRTAGGGHAVHHNIGCRGFRGEAALSAFETAIDRALKMPAWDEPPATVRLD